MEKNIILALILICFCHSYCFGSQDLPEKEAAKSSDGAFLEESMLSSDNTTESEQLSVSQDDIAAAKQPSNSVDSILSGIHRSEPWSGVIVDGTKSSPMTLDAAIQQALQNNHVIEESRLQWVFGIRKAQASWGAFEPDLVGNYNRNGVKRENSTLESLEQAGSRLFTSQSNDFNGAFEGKFLSGANYNIGLTVNEAKSNLITDQDYKSFAGVTVKQPLLKGAWFGSPLSEVKAAKRDRSIAFHSYRKQAMKTVTETALVYWNLVFAQEQYRIAEDSVAISQKLVEDCRERLNSGKMSNLDLLEAEAGLAESQSNLADVKQKILDVMKQFKMLLSANCNVDNRWFVATETFEGAVYEDQNKLLDRRQTLLKQVDIAQPDLIIAREKLEREKILLNYQKDQRLVELNAKGSYGVNGFGKSYKKSLDKLDEAKTPSWSIGVEMRIPLFEGVTERNELAAARLKTEMAKQRLKATQEEIVFSINALFLRIEALKKRVDSTRKVVEFKKKRLDTELIRFKEGKSNSRLIWEIQKEYADAREEEMGIILKYKEAMLELVFMSGAVLQDRGLEIIEDNKVLLADN